MSNEALISNPSSSPVIAIADFATDFSTGAPATPANNMGLSGVPTQVQMDIGAVAASGGSRESAKFDFGASRPVLYRLDVCMEFALAVTVGGSVNFRIGASNNSTAANGNPGGLTGVDAAYVQEDDLLAQMHYVGSLSCDDGNVVQKGFVGFYEPTARYGILVMTNSANQAVATVVDEAHFVLTPVTFGT